MPSLGVYSAEDQLNDLVYGASDVPPPAPPVATENSAPSAAAAPTNYIPGSTYIPPAQAAAPVAAPAPAPQGYATEPTGGNDTLGAASVQGGPYQIQDPAQPPPSEQWDRAVTPATNAWDQQWTNAQLMPSTGRQVTPPLDEPSALRTAFRGDNQPLVFQLPGTGEGTAAPLALGDDRFAQGDTRTAEEKRKGLYPPLTLGRGSSPTGYGSAFSNDQVRQGTFFPQLTQRQQPPTSRSNTSGSGTLNIPTWEPDFSWISGGGIGDQTATAQQAASGTVGGLASVVDITDSIPDAYQSYRSPSPSYDYLGDLINGVPSATPNPWEPKRGSDTDVLDISGFPSWLGGVKDGVVDAAADAQTEARLRASEFGSGQRIGSTTGIGYTKSGDAGDSAAQLRAWGRSQNQTQQTPTANSERTTTRPAPEIDPGSIPYVWAPDGNLTPVDDVGSAISGIGAQTKAVSALHFDPTTGDMTMSDPAFLPKVSYDAAVKRGETPAALDAEEFAALQVAGLIGDDVNPDDLIDVPVMTPKAWGPYIKGSPFYAGEVTYTEIPGTDTTSVVASNDGGSDWVDYGNDSSGGYRRSNYSRGGGGGGYSRGGGGRSYGGGGYSDGGDWGYPGEMPDLASFFGPDAFDNPIFDNIRHLLRGGGGSGMRGMKRGRRRRRGMRSPMSMPMDLAGIPMMGRNPAESMNLERLAAMRDRT